MNAENEIELRLMAEDRFAELNDGFTDELPEGMLALVQELRAHQIELEMQNVELRKVESELTASRDRYSNLYNFSPTGYVTLSNKLIVEEANLTFASMLDTDMRHLLSVPFSKFISKEDQDNFYLHHRKVFSSGLKQTVALRLKRESGIEFWVKMETSPDKSDDASGKLLLSILDITEQASLEQQLRQAQKWKLSAH